MRSPIERVFRAIRSLVTRGEIRSVTRDTGIQELEVAMLSGDEDKGVEHFQPYGLSAGVPAGAECVCLRVCGDPGHVVVVVADDRASRPTDLEDGEVAFYSKHGQKIVCKTDGSIVAIPKAGKTFDIGEAASKALALAEDVDARLQTLQQAHDTHTHVTTATIDAGPVGALAPTAAPVGSLATVASQKGRAE